MIDVNFSKFSIFQINFYHPYLVWMIWMQLCKLVIRLIIDFKSNECFNRYDLLRKIWLRSLQIPHQFMKQSKEILPIRQQSFLIQFGLVPNDLFNSNQFLPRKVFASLSIPLIHVIFIQMSEYRFWFGYFFFTFFEFPYFPARINPFLQSP